MSELIKPILPIPEMNKTELAYSWHLEGLKQSGLILSYRFTAAKLKLAKDTTYTPDFLVVFHDRFRFVEVKGFWRDDARVKIKVAREMYPYFEWVAVTKRRGGGWDEEIF